MHRGRCVCSRGAGSLCYGPDTCLVQLIAPFRSISPGGDPTQRDTERSAGPCRGVQRFSGGVQRDSLFPGPVSFNRRPPFSAQNAGIAVTQYTACHAVSLFSEPPHTPARPPRGPGRQIPTPGTVDNHCGEQSLAAVCRARPSRRHVAAPCRALWCPGCVARPGPAARAGPVSTGLLRGRACLAPAPDRRSLPGAVYAPVS